MRMVSADIVIESVRGVLWYSGRAVFCANRLPDDGFDVCSAFHTFLLLHALLLYSDACGYLFGTSP